MSCTYFYSPTTAKKRLGLQMIALLYFVCTASYFDNIKSTVQLPKKAIYNVDHWSTKNRTTIETEKMLRCYCHGIMG